MKIARSGRNCRFPLSKTDNFVSIFFYIEKGSLIRSLSFDASAFSYVWKNFKKDIDSSIDIPSSFGKGFDSFGSFYDNNDKLHISYLAFAFQILKQSLVASELVSVRDYDLLAFANILKDYKINPSLVSSVANQRHIRRLEVPLKSPKGGFKPRNLGGKNIDSQQAIHLQKVLDIIVNQSAKLFSFQFFPQFFDTYIDWLHASGHSGRLPSYDAVFKIFASRVKKLQLLS